MVKCNEQKKRAKLQFNIYFLSGTLRIYKDIYIDQPDVTFCFQPRFASARDVCCAKLLEFCFPTTFLYRCPFVFIFMFTELCECCIFRWIHLHFEYSSWGKCWARVSMCFVRHMYMILLVFIEQYARITTSTRNKFRGVQAMFRNLIYSQFLIKFSGILEHMMERTDHIVMRH